MTTTLLNLILPRSNATASYQLSTTTTILGDQLLGLSFGKILIITIITEKTLIFLPNPTQETPTVINPGSFLNPNLTQNLTLSLLNLQMITMMMLCVIRLSQVQLILAAAVILLDLAQTMKTLLRCILARRLRTRRSVPIGLRVNATRVTVAGFCILGLLGSPFVCLATLKGHEKAVSGITLPQGSNKLFSACEDGVVSAWDCYTGKCAGSLNLGGKIRCVLGAVPWVFIVVPNAIKVFSCNPPNAVDLSLSGPVGQVNALDFVDGMLFAGIEDGTILSWRFNAGNLFEEAARFDGHKLSVVTLVARSYGKLYSGSTDHTLKVWDIRTSQCLQTLTDHS
eukprot:TRINITY_DN5717_c0_g1_i15.p1 TRINITY_DN5717_c0_g1~~TRINITY_DN5717_c0_g1_i15.p1  ORF type:complete len:339 (-),score=40.69 TRINITY_DN5717_c0_g1_i15:723-1739(-)